MLQSTPNPDPYSETGERSQASETESKMLQSTTNPHPVPDPNTDLHTGTDEMNHIIETDGTTQATDTDKTIQAPQVFPKPPNPRMSEIVPGLFIGDYWSSWQPDGLQQNHIRSVLSVNDEPTANWRRDCFTRYVTEDRHLKLFCLDNSSQDILFHLQRACDFIEASLAHGGVLVHCVQGVSRSTAFVIAYLMRRERRGLDEVLANVKLKRKVRPSENFKEQLRLWGEIEYEVWENEEIKVPKEPYAKLLKEKGLTHVLPKSKAEIAFGF